MCHRNLIDTHHFMTLDGISMIFRYLTWKYDKNIPKGSFCHGVNLNHLKSEHCLPAQKQRSITCARELTENDCGI